MDSSPVPPTPSLPEPPPAPPMPPPPPPPAPPSVIVQSAPARESSNGCFWLVIIVLVLGLAVSLLANVMLAGGSLSSALPEIDHPHEPSALSEVMIQKGTKTSSDRIVHLDLEGVISSEGQTGSFLSPGEPGLGALQRALEQATKDVRVKAIVLRINSPGGEVTASDIFYNAVKKARAVKPVVAYMDSVAASGGYYIACGANKIVATNTTLTGSIGVIMEGMSYHTLLDKVGVGFNTFTSGKMKDMLSGARPLREDERAYVQGLVDSMYDRFLTVVAEGRGLAKDGLRNGVADGRIVDANTALKEKLVDQIGYIEDAYSLARELAKSPNASIVHYRSEPRLFDLLGLNAQAKAKPPALELQLPGASALPRLKPGLPYYLPSAMAH